MCICQRIHKYFVQNSGNICVSMNAAWWETEDEMKLNTLTWKLKDDVVQSSLNVSLSASMALARATTSFLRTFYAQRTTAHESVKRVASPLRGAKHMVTGGAVGQTLYLWCASFIDGRAMSYLQESCLNF